MSLLDISYVDGEMRYENRRVRGASDFRAHLADARRRCTDAESQAAGEFVAPITTDDFERLRWFPYPGEGAGLSATAQNGAFEPGAVGLEP
jgi:hypothetical protein